MTDKLHSVIFHETCEAIAGPEYASAIGELVGINDRTIRRIREAAINGREYPAARGAISALYEALTDIVWELKPVSDRIARERKREAAD